MGVKSSVEMDRKSLSEIYYNNLNIVSCTNKQEELNGKVTGSVNSQSKLFILISHDNWTIYLIFHSRQKKRAGLNDPTLK